jgi:hypothetical protein
VLVFQQPLRESLGISDEDWPACLSRVDHRLRSLPLSPLPVPLVESHLHDRQPIPTPVKAREKLLQAAEDLLAFRLESNVRGRELADHAGVNYGLVNHYFGSKNAVFDEVLERLHERFRDDVVEVFAEADMLRLGLDEVFSRHLPFLRSGRAACWGSAPYPGSICSEVAGSATACWRQGVFGLVMDNGSWMPSATPSLRSGSRPAGCSSGRC